MKNLFKVDGNLYNLLENFSDYVLLNIAFVLGCLPLVTIGASLTALYDISNKLHNGEKCSIFSEFFKSYKNNFKKSTFIWVIQFIIYLIVFLYIIMFKDSSALIAKVYYVFTILIAYINLAISIYIYPTISRYNYNIRGYFQFAFVTSNMFFLYTMLMMIISVTLIFVIFESVNFIGWSLFIFLIFGFSLVAYIFNLILSKVFERLEIKNES
jgi:uncharacterized membrane protein YesL